VLPAEAGRAGSHRYVSNLVLENRGWRVRETTVLFSLTAVESWS
jgi:hypothetical protein